MRIINILAILLLFAGRSSAVEVRDLSGQWRFAVDAEDQGVRQQWFAKELSDTIRLPGTTDQAGVGGPEPDPNPGHLSRTHKYIGAAWYQREIEVPADWVDREIELYLERVLWESRVWVDDRFCDSQDSLGTPHIHHLGQLSPGRHTLTLRIDNRMIHPLGDRGHCYTEFTQIKWNGAVGRLQLRAYNPVRLGLVRVFPDLAARQVTVETTLLNNSGDRREGLLSLRLIDPDGKSVAEAKAPVELTGPEVTLKPVLTLNNTPRPWDEFGPNIYQLEVGLAGKDFADRRAIRFGFRTLKHEGNRLLVNGRPTFLRGNLDCGQYPLTGHPPTSVKDWQRVFRIHQDYGMNHVRFHSWCPPEAAFVAADRMGIYLLPEVLWIDHWMGYENPRKDMNTEGHPLGVGKGDRTIDQYVRAEMRRMLDTYGNHPSFCFFAIGNELGSSNFEVMGQWIAEEKQRDPRRLYAASTARTITPHDDFSDTHNIPGIGGVVNRLGVPHTDWDYQGSYGRAEVPIIAHEMGQMPVYPCWSEIDKYTGPVRAKSFELFREQARKSGIESQSAALQQASGAMNRIIYKNEMEAQLRSPGCAGVSWLSLQDFPGQGEALVGWLDTFYESKGLVTPEQFRRYSSPTVPLARFKKFVWTNDETFAATAQIAHWGEQDLQDVELQWRLKTSDGRELAGDTLRAPPIVVGEVATIGEISCKLDGVTAASRLKLELRIPGTSVANDWDLWVFPADSDEKQPENVVVTGSAKGAWAALSQGKRVLLLAHKYGSSKQAGWMPLFWSSRFFPGQHSETLGALVDSRHPALALMPTADHLDWQWIEICNGARGFVLDDQPADYRPIVQPVSDYHFNHKLGTIFEFATAEGGRLLVCGYNLVDQLPQQPATRQLHKSLLRYAAGERFDPSTRLSGSQFEQLFPIVEEAKFAKAPPKFKDAVLYIRAGAHHPGRGNVAWERKLDEVVASEGFDYQTHCDAVWKDDVGTAWWGSPVLRVEIECKRPNLYDLYVHFHDWNQNGRTGTLTFEGRKYELGPHAGEGAWVKLDVLREDALDQKLVLEARNTTGPNLQITAIALVPR